MFNPQRKTKVADIFMQEKVYSMHLKKMDQIQRSDSSKFRRYTQQSKQQTNLLTLNKSKKQVKSRCNQNIKKQNNKLLKRLRQNDCRKDQHSPTKSKSKQKLKHFNSYFSNKKQNYRLHTQNYGLVMRMNQLSSSIPSLKQLKKQYKKNKKLSKICQKLPAIIRNQEQYRTKMCDPVIQNSRTLHLHLGK